MIINELASEIFVIIGKYNRNKIHLTDSVGNYQGNFV